MELSDESDLEKARALNGTSLEGQTLSIDKAKPKRTKEQVEQDNQSRQKSRDEESKCTYCIKNFVTV